MSVMQNRLLPALLVLLLAFTARTAAAQTALQLRWELVADSQAAFTLGNRGTKPLPPSGWAIYFSALHSAQPGSGGGGRLRRTRPRSQRSDPVPHRPAPESQLRAEGSL